MLEWHGFVRGNVSAENEEAMFFGADGEEMVVVPENHRVNVSAYLEAGKVYAPVISAIPNGDPGSSGGGCASFASGLIICLPLLIILRRFSSHV